MKHIKIIFLIISIFFNAINGYSQNENVQNEIKTFARYTTLSGVELRIIPSKKHLLNLGVKNGYTIERAPVNSSSFSKIGEVKPFSKIEWEKLINSETNITKKKQIQMAVFFYESILEENGVEKIDFSNGIKDLIDKKSNEDLSYLITLLSALKDKHIAEALGLSFYDKTAIKGKTYQYRAKLTTSDNKYQIKSSVFSITAQEEKPNYKNYFYVKQGDTHLSFYWEEIPTLHGFEIERADFGKTNFIKLNKSPIYTTIKLKNSKIPYGYVDKNLLNYKKYTYVFYASSVFGERIKLFETTTNSVDLTPPPTPNLLKPEHKKPNEVFIKWTMKNTPKDLKGFAVARSTKNKGKFTILHKNLLSKNTHNFIDKTFSKEQTNYYIVQAIDTANNISSSTPFAVVLTDSIPPKKPIIKSITINSLGVAKINIELNKEKDLMGYRLFRANSEKHEFSVIQEGFKSIDSPQSNIKTTFKDTISLNSLTKHIYYRVKALDYHYNQSDFSDIYVLKRPDTIPPSTPVFKTIKAYENKIELTFALSTSRDLKNHILYRKSSLEGKWEVLSEIEKNQINYVDKKVQKNVTYYYSLRAQDNANLFSNYAVTVYTKLVDKGVLPSITQFTVSKKDSKIHLKWNYNTNNKNIYFVIYKRINNQKLKQYKQSKNNSFEDFLSKDKVAYAIKAYTKKGKQSALSEIKTIK